VQQRNPYGTPRTRVADAEGDEDYGEIKIFSAQSRLGRVRYIGYSTGVGLLFALVAGAMTAVSPEAVGVVATVGYIALFAVSILLTIQRAHDFDSSGWMSLLIFVPLVNLIFWFIPGTRGENRFGKRPPPNTVGAIVLACLLPGIFVLGIVAAIAIPAYQDYVHRAEQAQISQGR
jgi:uncharacterized membrane protein YhaH (DUF805 family)